MKYKKKNRGGEYTKKNQITVQSFNQCSIFCILLKHLSSLYQQLVLPFSSPDEGSLKPKHITLSFSHKEFFTFGLFCFPIFLQTIRFLFIIYFHIHTHKHIYTHFQKFVHIYTHFQKFVHIELYVEKKKTFILFIFFFQKNQIF